MDINDLVFKREDCIVVLPEAEYDGRGPSKRRPRIGMVNSSNETIMSKEDMNRITVIHPQTDLSVTEDRFIAYRNKELAFQRLEVLVNKKIEELKARIKAKQEASAEKKSSKK